MKKMTTRKQLEKIVDEMDEQKETAIILHVDEKDNVSMSFAGNSLTMAALVATAVHNGLSKDAEEGKKKLAESIVDGVAEVLSIPSYQGIRIGLKMNKAIMQAVKNKEKGICSLLDKALGIVGRDDDDDEDEDCSTCKANKVCPLTKAVEWRKENGIPAPSYAKKGRKNRKQKDDNAN